MQIKFIGVPGEEHASIRQYGYDFPMGEFVDVTDERAAAKLANHPHFSAKAESSDQPLPPREELVAKAAELGIEYDKRLGDKKLAALILEKMSANLA
ncbi:hypothetical protein [Variovorax sp. JS1663]|uniref:hypothetical protein n=1 Tax=Variovorax sp. JS1663 TaxID=1851577 RepID=UPI000B349FB8|nr:hypothetical protein [Variovorax sp. JS1663]OUM01667.1 hypothetical protein A8M77_15450 [Variovorax sp. JS1663]